MLHKLLVICFFTTTFTMVAMDDPSLLRIPSGRSPAAEMAVKAAQERHRLFVSTQESTNAVFEQPQKPDARLLQSYEPYPDIVKGNTPCAKWLEIKTSAQKDTQRLKQKGDSVSSEIKSKEWSDEEKFNLLEVLLKFPAIDPSNGNTILHYAAATQEAPDLVALLLEKKPDLKTLIDHYNKQGVTPLLLALIKGNEKGAIALMEHGANVKLPEKIESADSQK